MRICRIINWKDVRCLLDKILKPWASGNRTTKGNEEVGIFGLGNYYLRLVSMEWSVINRHSSMTVINRPS